MKDYKITTRTVFFMISLITGLIMLSNFIDYQHNLSTGDHGLLLYAAESSFRGELPYKDFHYFYGPFMPYYYGLFMKLLGSNIVSVLIGYQFLKLANGLIVYGILSIFLNPFVALAGCVWFWVYNLDFFYTYNHIGIITASLYALYCVFNYLKYNTSKNLYYGLIACVIAGLIKLNYGFSILLGLVLSILLINFVEKRSLGIKFYLTSIIITPATILALNASFLINLPFHIIKQCFQYFGNDVFSQNYLPLPLVASYVLKTTYIFIVKNWLTDFVLVCFALISIILAYQVKEGAIKTLKLKNLMLLVLIPLIFLFVHLHEFIISGVLFRTFYSFPFIIIFLYMGLAYYAHQIPKVFQIILASFALLISLFTFHTLTSHMNAFHRPIHYLSTEKGKVFVSNPLPWPQTVMQTTQYLKNNVGEDERFFALPYEPLYYFLTDKKSPTRQLVLFEFLNISQEQELDIIKELEANNTQWIVISNRSIAQEIGLGLFGVTYCPILAKYINDNFDLTKEFGRWSVESSWAQFHATRILKRKVP